MTHQHKHHPVIEPGQHHDGRDHDGPRHDDGYRRDDGHRHDDHDHAGGWVPRLRHAVSGLVGGHSHDAADQIDNALEANAQGRRALWISLAALAVTAALQAVVVVFTGSVALLGESHRV